MLRQRVITAVLLLIVLLPALMASAFWPFAALSLAFVAAGGWEWGRLNAAGMRSSLLLAAAVAAGCGAAWFSGWALAAPALVWWLALALWVLGGALALRAGPQGWGQLSLPWRWTIGVVVLWLTWLAMCAARAQGLNFILSVFALVWVSDIAAYFGGRAWGRRKLAPSISPGKSWEGVWSGMLGVLLLAGLWVVADRAAQADSSSIYTRLLASLGWIEMLLVTVFLTAMGVVGDLSESLVKRHAGAKDSSGLLPGHGGVLDRVDALLPVFPMALAFCAL
jgi:phosphatidate cytidylyltransferase